VTTERGSQSDIPWVGSTPRGWRVAPLFTQCMECKEKNAGYRETNVLSLSYGHIVRRDVSNNFGLLPESALPGFGWV
jgi:type I restriction enzyme S subunit